MHVAIIGNGIAGITAAQQVRRHHPDWQISIISGESKFHYSRPALMYLFMGHMRYPDTKPYEDHYWAQQRFQLVRDWVTSIDLPAKRLQLHRGECIGYDKLLIATGSVSNRFGWKGQELDGVQGLYDLMDLRQLYENCKTTRRAVIVGGGLIGIELAEMLHTRGIHVSFVVREQSYWDNVLPKEESGMINRIIRRQGFELLLERNLDEIVDDGNGQACAVMTDRGERIECQLVGLTAGVKPNTTLAKDAGLELGRGILVDDSLQSSAPDVFAAGDCAEIRRPGEERNLIQQVWYTGKMQGAVAGDAMSGRAAHYDPGIWYNSAKFLDLEYQVYGRVNLKVAGERSLYWEHPNGLHSLRLVHVDGQFIGINLMGQRYRHEVCESWIREERSVPYVLEHLHEANFDPEFFTRHEDAIVSSLRGQLS